MSADVGAVMTIGKQLSEARVALGSEQKVLASLEMKNGQDFATNITVCGKTFHLVRMGTNYYPERVESLNVVREELIKYQKGVIQYHLGAIEGLEFKLLQAARGATP